MQEVANAKRDNKWRKRQFIPEELESSGEYQSETSFYLGIKRRKVFEEHGSRLNEWIGTTGSETELLQETCYES